MQYTMGKKLSEMTPAEMHAERTRGRDRYILKHPNARGGARVDDPRTPEDFRAEAEEHRRVMLLWHEGAPARRAAYNRAYNALRRSDPELKRRNCLNVKSWTDAHPELASLYGRRSVLRKYLRDGKTVLKNGLDVFEELDRVERQIVAARAATAAE